MSTFLITFLINPFAWLGAAMLLAVCKAVFESAFDHTGDGYHEPFIGFWSWLEGVSK